MEIVYERDSKVIRCIQEQVNNCNAISNHLSLKAMKVVGHFPVLATHHVLIKVVFIVPHLKIHWTIDFNKIDNLLFHLSITWFLLRDLS
jgi:hypothetical protein